MADNTKKITGFRFVWSEKQTQQEDFTEFIEPFLAKIKVEQTGEILELRVGDIGKVIKLSQPIQAVRDINNVCEPFGNPSNFKVHLKDRTEDSGRYFAVDVRLNNFFNQNGSVPTIVIIFIGPFFCISAQDITPTDN